MYLDDQKFVIVEETTITTGETTVVDSGYMSWPEVQRIIDHYIQYAPLFGVKTEMEVDGYHVEFVLFPVHQAILNNLGLLNSRSHYFHKN